MNDSIIKVEGLGKKYIISHEKKESYTALRDVISRRTKTLLTRSKNISSVEEFWALKDVSFEIKQGESVGIIGRNGAGKSTLLKVLSRITEPTTGHVEMIGRVASLLEVGTGFHPELTGKENVYLNGAILGMSRKEIKKKFDDIVEFSGVERFLDTPVKRYSSGMYVRLAFAVAAYLEPEILVVDEVLAVGDAEFQKKCLGKMNEVSRSGRTVLFVSHNMAAVKSLCTKGIVLQNGQIKFQGGAMDAVSVYQSLGLTASKSVKDWPSNEIIKIKNFTVNAIKGDLISISSGISFKLEFYNVNTGINLDTTFELKTMDETVVFHHGALITTNNDSQKGIYKVTGEIPPFYINAGNYYFKLIFGESQHHVLFSADNILHFEVLNDSLGSNNNVLPGILRPDIRYQFSFDDV
jgi:lipopolysaccharide transport system ATP-binding protein